jgi:hypothetical protein
MRTAGGEPIGSKSFGGKQFDRLPTADDSTGLLANVQDPNSPNRRDGNSPGGVSGSAGSGKKSSATTDKTNLERTQSIDGHDGL